GALHQAQRLERDDRRSRDVRIGCSKVADEAPRAVAVPDVDGGMDLQQEAPGVAHELGPKLGRHVGEADLAGDEVVLEPLEALDEVAVELILQMGEGWLAHLDVGLTDLSNQPTDVVDDDPE